MTNRDQRTAESVAAESRSDLGPYYDDLTVDHVFPSPSPVTITSGMAAVYQSIVGDPIALCLDGVQSRRVTGVDRPLANPALVMHLSIGASTVATRRVLANLFYRNVVLRRPVFVGETLSTETRVIGLADASAKPGVRPRGKVLLEITTTTDDGEVVLKYQRCALLPCRGTESPGHRNALGTAELGTTIEQLPSATVEALAAAVPTTWQLDSLARSSYWEPGSTIVDPLADVIDQATSLVRLTNNLAETHRDQRASTYGQRLVYGGHVIGLAQASLSRCRPGLVTVLGWISGDHLGPAFEDDVLSFRHRSLSEVALPMGQLRMVETTATAHRRGLATGGDHLVLRWRPIILERVHQQAEP